MAATLRAIVTLAVSAASLVFFLWQFGTDWPGDYASKNILRFALRKDLRNALFMTAALVGVVSALYWA
ncbi:MAG: hypothetical protein ABW133_10490, partial [Polyangiaceae bacterium]